MFIRVLDTIARFGLPICAGLMGLVSLFAVIHSYTGWADNSVGVNGFYIACLIWTIGVITYKIKVRNKNKVRN